MDKRRIAYIAATGLFCLAILPSGIMNIAQPQMVVDAMTAIDLPMYVLALIGMWKLLGIVALAQPKFTRINEWAYAGFVFDLSGALVSRWTPLVIAVLPSSLTCAPMRCSSSTCIKRFSNTDSVIVPVPAATQLSAVNCACMSVGNPG